MSNAPKAAATAVVKASPIDGMVLAVMQRIEKRQAKLENLLPKGVDVGRFTETIRFALAQEPSLLKCTQESMVLAVMRAARTGLFPDKEMAALVKYGDEATFVPMFKGLLALCRATGLVNDITPILVHEHDVFSVEEGEKPHVEHRPFIPKKATESRGEIIATYCRVTLPTGERLVKGLLYADDIARIESSVKAKGGPWGGPHRGEMIKKSAVKNAVKNLGVPPGDTFVSLRQALAADTAAETGEVLQELRRVEEELPQLPNGNQRLRTVIQERNPELAPVPPPREPGADDGAEDPACVAAQEAAAAEPGSAG